MVSTGAALFAISHYLALGALPAVQSELVCGSILSRLCSNTLVSRIWRDACNASGASLVATRIVSVAHQRFQVQAYPFHPAIAGALNGMWLLTHNMLCTLTAACHRICSCCVSMGQGRTVERVLRTRCQKMACNVERPPSKCTRLNQLATNRRRKLWSLAPWPKPVEGAYVKKRTSQVSWARNSGRWHVRRYFPESVPHTASVR